MSVYVIGTLDTKGRDVAWLADRLKSYGIAPLIVDTGCLDPPTIKPDISREEVFLAAGTPLGELQSAADRGRAVTAAARGISRLIKDHHAAGDVDGILAVGGSAGTTIGTAAMRELPLGVPKVMVSTMASGSCRQYVGGKDILMLNSVVDIAGLNRISGAVLGNAARAVAGMVTLPPRAEDAGSDRPLIAASMFGVTTPCVLHAQSILEDAGYEVLVFHATGNGGEAMEGLIDDGLIAGVLDITTTELADELIGGVLSAGPKRLTAAGRRNVPQVVSVGATDMVNFGPPQTIPDKFSGRKFYHHNSTVTLMRTTVDECRQIGSEIGRKVGDSAATTVLLPEQGVSAIDATDQPFEDAAARKELFTAIEAAAPNAPIKKLDLHINDTEFAEAAARELLRLMKEATPA